MGKLDIIVCVLGWSPSPYALLIPLLRDSLKSLFPDTANSLVLSILL